MTLFETSPFIDKYEAASHHIATQLLYENYIMARKSEYRNSCQQIQYLCIHLHRRIWFCVNHRHTCNWIDSGLIIALSYCHCSNSSFFTMSALISRFAIHSAHHMWLITSSDSGFLIIVSRLVESPVCTFSQHLLSSVIINLYLALYIIMILALIYR